ncbi:MAG: hypothetical protein LYZ69_03375 [Nitrososphaerales archaeon]|nr:hypothetical protein [Nitrososphaerales archaeon]
MYEGEEGVPDALDLLIDWAVSNRAFKRNKVGVKSKVLAAALVASGVSYREAAVMLGGMSFIAVRDSYLRIASLLPKGERKHRRFVAIDESVIRIGGGPSYLWLARDVDSGETISFRCSFSGSPEDSAAFAGSVLENCSNRPAARLGRGANRPKALKNLDFYFQTEGPSGVVQMIQRIFGVGSR